jgi:hypothetical protein
LVRLLVSSAGSANGGGYGAILSFDSEGEPLGPFSGDPRIADQRLWQFQQQRLGTTGLRIRAAWAKAVQAAGGN